jgi:hypothetical protein
MWNLSLRFGKILSGRKNELPIDWKGGTDLSEKNVNILKIILITEFS